jgi:DNA-binding transcriptional LysR family regulator
LSATRAGIGIGAHDCVLADAEPDLERLLHDHFKHEIEIWLVTHADMRRSARIRTVFDFLGEAIAADRHPLTGRPAMGNAA